MRLPFNNHIPWYIMLFPPCVLYAVLSNYINLNYIQTPPVLDIQLYSSYYISTLILSCNRLSIRHDKLQTIRNLSMHETNIRICYIPRDFPQKNLLRQLLLPEIELRYLDFDSTPDMNAVFVMESTEQIQQYHVPEVFLWDDILRSLYDYARTHFFGNYDYYYLKNAMLRAQQPQNTTIIVGSSYARFGIETNLLKEPAVNLALSSQDLYYACTIARGVIDQNEQIKNVVIGMGYYYFFSDLSRVTNEGEQLRISNVYYPLFHDSHHRSIDPQTCYTFDFHPIFNISKALDLFSLQFYNDLNGNYFFSGHGREDLKTNLWNNTKSSWSELDEQTKSDAGRTRALMHNKSAHYSQSLEENIALLNEFILFCNSRDIKVNLVVFPSTTYYNKYIDKNMKLHFEHCLSLIAGEAYLYDMNLLDVFVDSDFIDTDHLNDTGAQKMTHLLNDLLFS